jgi:hypothetical protein
MKSAGVIAGICILIGISSFGQVDTSYIYNSSTAYGTLDIRIAKSASRYYYLEDNKTFNFRESGGSKTNSYFDMTSWDSSPYAQGNLREKNGSSNGIQGDVREWISFDHHDAWSRRARQLLG